MENKVLSGEERVLIIKPSSLGDVVHTLPAVSALKQRFPGLQIDWLVNPEWAPLLAENSCLNRVIIFPRRELGGLTGSFRLPGWLRSIGKLSPDLTLDFQGLLRSALIARFARSREVWGLSDAREGAGLFYTRTVDVDHGSHAVDRYFRLACALGAEQPTELDYRLPEGDPVPGFDESRPFVLLHPFSRGEGKSLPLEKIRELCSQLSPIRVVLAGRAEQDPGDFHGENLLNRTTLTQLIRLVRKAVFIVSVDSGPMHIAAAITDSVISLHAWSDPKLVGPYASNAWIWKSGVISRVTDYRPPVSDLSLHELQTEQLSAFIKTQLT